MENDAVPARVGSGRPALDFHGSIAIAHDSELIQLTADGSRITLDASSLAVLRELLASLPIPPTALDSVVEQHQLHIEVHVKGNLVGRLEPGAEPTWMGSLSGIPGVTVSLSGVVRALLGQSGERPD
ncbi:MAG: hypothetical protein MUF01_14550 [Bryobacterales bacterium]|jgi:hypothetical protein|nr:hypothetical protein [Bryobacterales bacterium]